MPLRSRGGVGKRLEGVGHVWLCGGLGAFTDRILDERSEVYCHCDVHLNFWR